MSKKAQSVKNARGSFRSQQGSTAPTHRPMTFEKLQLLPDMPAFFPDPVALDMEDNFLKIFCDELFQQEYETSVRAICEKLEEQRQRQEQLGGANNSRVLSPDRIHLQISDNETDETREKTALNCRSSILIERTSTTSPMFDVVKLVEDMTTASLRTGTPQRRERVLSPKSTSGQSLPIAGETVSIFSVSSAVDGPKTKSTAHWKEGRQHRWHLIDKPVYFTQPFPPALYTLAETIGVKNVTNETRVAALSIAEVQKQTCVTIVPSMTFPPTMDSPTLDSPQNNDGTTGVCATSGGLLTPTQQSPRYVSTFLLADALVLEAEQRLAAEMFCASICDDIVELAAEMYISRSFDAMANIYTALSVWDEVRDAVTRSFVCRDPCEVAPAEFGSTSASPIQKIKSGLPVVSDTRAVVANNLRNIPLKSAPKSAGTHLPCFGILPQWALTPSILDADTILSFHHRATVSTRPFKVDENQKLKTIVGWSPDSAFSRFLAAPLKETGGMQAVEGVVKAHGSSFNHTVNDNGENEPGTEDGDHPGIPPNPIPLDNYARYVLPRIAEDLQSREGKEKKKREEATAQSKMGQRKTRRKSRTSLGIQSVDHSKEGGGDVEPPTSGNVLPLNSDHEVVEPNVEASKGKKRQQRVLPHGDTPNRIGTGSSGRETLSRLVVIDDFTKALQRLPSGFLGPSPPANSTGANVRNTLAEPHVLIEDDHAVIIAKGTKKNKQKQPEKKTGGSAAFSSAGSRRDARSPLLRDTAWADDGTAMLSINIANGGYASFQALPKESSGTMEANGDTETGSPRQQSVKDQQTTENARRYVFLTREKKKALEERQRRREEAAEQAAYESLFFTLPPPATNTGGSGESMDDVQEEAGSRKSSKIRPAPGVIVARWPQTPVEKKKKTNVSKTGKSRGRRGGAKSPSGSISDGDSVLADGGEWLLPEGKCRWSGVQPASKTKNATNVLPATVRDSRASFLNVLESGRRQQQQQVDEKEGKADESGLSQTAGPRSKSPVVLGARSLHRPPEMILVTTNDKKSEKKKQRGGIAFGEAVTDITLNSKTSGDRSDTRKRAQPFNLPRLPRRPPSSDHVKQEVSSSLRTPAAAERDNIRQLAFILMKARQNKGM